jgi:hypothetical protein
MATGTLGQAAPVAATLTTVYTVPATKVGTFNVSITNRTGYAIPVRLAISATATPTTAEYIEYDSIIPGNGVLERGGIVANAAENVVVYASVAGLSVSVYGYEE